MIRFIVAVLLAFAFFAGSAIASPRDSVPSSPAARAHHAAKHHVVKPHAYQKKRHGRHRRGHRQPHHVTAPVQAEGWHAPASGLVAVAERYLGSNPTGWAHVWCARFLNTVVLPAVGLHGTDDNTAISFARWGSPSGAHPGAVAVMSHHVTLVVRVNGDGTFDGLGGNQGHRVSISRYPMGRVVAWREPG